MIILRRLSKHFFQSSTHHGWIGINACPVLNSDDSLINQHAQTIYHFAPFLGHPAPDLWRVDWE